MLVLPLEFSRDIAMNQEPEESLENNSVENNSVENNSVEDDLVDIPDYTTMTVDEWRAAYEELAKHPPIEGDFLYADDHTGKEKLTKLTIECSSGKQPFVYGRAWIPNIVGSKLGWYSLGMESDSNYGWKLILLPKARNEVIAKFGMTKNEVGVKGLRVVKLSTSGKSLLVEVADY